MRLHRWQENIYKNHPGWYIEQEKKTRKKEKKKRGATKVN
jgi:hypothetical protein